MSVESEFPEIFGNRPNAMQTEGPMTPSEPTEGTDAPSVEAASGVARKKQKSRQPRRSTRVVAISFSAQREPVDDLVWAEAERDGNWTVVRSIEFIRTRRELLERILELDTAIVAIDAGFSFPHAFMEFLKEGEKVESWPSLLKHVRDDLKKNVEDGLRLWIDRMGAYREAHLEPNPEPIRSYERQRNGSRLMRERMPQPHEQASIAERFRRSELAIRRPAQQNVSSTIQIAYNKLTSRYEFSDERMRGRKSLMVMSLLEQLIEAKPEAAIWPWQRPKQLTIVEYLPWLFTREMPKTPDTLRVWLDAEEDAGTEIAAPVRDTILRNADAARTFFALMGIIRTEARIERAIRPLRDYPEQFYSDPQVASEGWMYGIGYKVQHEVEPEARGKKKKSNRTNKTHGRDAERKTSTASAKPAEEVKVESSEALASSNNSVSANDIGSSEEPVSPDIAIASAEQPAADSAAIEPIATAQSADEA